MFGSSARSTLLAGHDRASNALGVLGSIKVFVSDLMGRLFGSRNSSKDEELESALSSSSGSTWSSESDKDIKKRFILQKRSWGQQDLDVKGELEEGKESDKNLAVFFTRFLTGIVITQVFYLLLTYHSMWKPSTAAMWTGFFGFFISLGMAFLKPVRCIVALLLPTFSTGKGRYVVERR
ncbi:unnamed protein product [Clavelina lepadiformis]|uniref:Vesicle transport protein n=1 Tax=Clavelina lepadiformis TaxID=159417 RepID=A0ABP0GQH8_CLALP